VQRLLPNGSIALVASRISGRAPAGGIFMLMPAFDDKPSGTAASQKNPPGSGAWGVLLLAHGAPDSLADVPAFLLNVRGGRPLPQEAIEEIVQRYRVIGGGSPLLKHATRQAEALAEVLNRGRQARELPPLPVYVGMRNWKPFIADSVRRLSDNGVKRLLAVCLAPHHSRTSIGLYRQHLAEAVEKLAPHIQVEFVSSWHDQPELIAAFREKIAQGLEYAERAAGSAVPVVLTAHSVPERTIAEGDPYKAQVEETAKLVAESTPLARWCLAYQSQGMTSEPWIGPTVESRIDELAAEGHRHVLIAPIGFVCDHVEILYDVDIASRQYGRERGVNVWRSESLNDSPRFIGALHALVTAHLQAVDQGSAP
jgi:protoporphyrin/coproporphyrin ferrochelatase